VFRDEGWTNESPYSRHEFSRTSFGGGPHLGLQSHVLFGATGWALYGRADSAVAFGNGKSTYCYQSWEPHAFGFIDPSYSTTNNSSEFHFDVGLQLALTRRWQLQRAAVGLCLGVQGDILSIGELGNESTYTFGLGNAGPFLRLEDGF
jgi:hypothetical protein